MSSEEAAAVEQVSRVEPIQPTTTTTTQSSAESSPVKSARTEAASRRPSEDSLRPPQVPYAASSPELHTSLSSGSLASSYRPGGFGTGADSTLSSKPSQTPLADWGQAASDAVQTTSEKAMPDDETAEDETDSGRQPQHRKPYKPANRFGGGGGRDWRFWMVFLSILLSTFIAALDMVRAPSWSLTKVHPWLTASAFIIQTAISTAAPVIVNSLHGKEFTWMSVAATT